MDILFNTDDYVFSYRVAGILIQDDKVLLQKTVDDSGYAFPGGHVEFGETNAQTLVREFKEEINADISVGDLKWVSEVFFTMKNKPCHQICLYYSVNLKPEGNDNIPLSGSFIGKEYFMRKDLDIQFHWIPLKNLSDILVYPKNAEKLLKELDNGVQHFIDKE